MKVVSRYHFLGAKLREILFQVGLLPWSPEGLWPLKTMTL